MTFKTDPQNSDYIVESGASRNFEPWRKEDEVVEKEKQKRDAEEMGDAMKSLENRTLDSKREMDILAALDEMKSMKSRHATVSVDSMLEALQNLNEQKAKKIEEEDEADIRALYRDLKEKNVKRIQDEDIEDDEDDFGLGTSNAIVKRQKTTDITDHVKTTDSLTKASISDASDSQGGPSKDRKLLFKSPSVIITVKKKSGKDSSSNKPMVSEKINQEMEQDKVVSDTGLQSLCQQYGSDDDDDDE